MNRIRAGLLLALLAALSLPAIPGHAQSANGGKVVRIGRLSPLSAETDGPNLAAFRQGLRELGCYAAFSTPRHITGEADGRVAVPVHQVVRELAGAVLKEQTVQHVYAFEGYPMVVTEHLAARRDFYSWDRSRLPPASPGLPP